MRTDAYVVSHSALLVRVACMLAVSLSWFPGMAGAQARTAEPTGLLQAVASYLTSTLGVPASIDPRPLRPGIHAANGLGVAGMLLDTTLIQLRLADARIAGLKIADILVDQECTFTEGVKVPPGTALSPEAVERERHCQSRGRFTTFALGLVPPEDRNGVLGPVRVIAFTASGYHVRDLWFTKSIGSTWTVERAKSVFEVMS